MFNNVLIFGSGFFLSKNFISWTVITVLRIYFSLESDVLHFPNVLEDMQVSEESERQVYRYLIFEVQGMLAAFPTTLKEDRTMTGTTYTLQCAQQLRIENKEILESINDICTKELEKLNAL